jgi:hypothetical protein
VTLDRTKIELPFARGLNQQADPRLTEEPDLVRAIDVEFDELGGLRLRYPYESIGTNIFGGGTISDCRRIYAVGRELILFTATALYAWSPERSAWVLRGTHLAVKVDEEPVFVATGDQTQCDRAELDGTIVYAWTDSGSASYAAAVDATTGAVIAGPTLIGGARPRVVPLDTTFLLFDVNSSSILHVRAIDPADPETGFASTPSAVLDIDRYDVERIPGQDAAIFVARFTSPEPTTSYKIGTVTSGLVITDVDKARSCDGVIAVACTADGTQAQVVRSDGANIVGDLITVSSLADADTDQALGSGTTPINQIAAAFVDSTTCHVWWTSNAATDATGYDTDHNTVTVGGTIGTPARFIYRLQLATRAFAYDGEAYVWLQFFGASSFSGASPSAFRAQLQNTYFLYRADGLLVAKAAWQRAGGLDTDSYGHLPGVGLVSGSTGFAWCAVDRRIVPLGDKQSGYGDSGPRDITFTFDSNAARRAARLGDTVYVTGGEILQYDGTRLVEAGFHLYPHYFGAIEVGDGNLTDGVYTIKVGWRYDNGRGERERSTTATHGQVTIASGPNGISIVSWVPLHVTHKEGVAVEVWRTKVNSAAPFFLATSRDPGVTSNPNRYIANDPTALLLDTFNDELVDDDIAVLEPHPENDDVLENMAPPAAALIAANDTRIFLGDVAGEPDQVRYSKLRAAGELAAFHDGNVIQIPPAGGAMTGLEFLLETLVVFRETAIYLVDGRGYPNTGGVEGNYEARLVATDIGAVNQESIALTPAGLVFKSKKGWYLLNRGFTLQYIGGAVRDYDAEEVHAAHVIETQHQVRIVTASRVLIFDYAEGAQLKWGEWSIAGGLHACVWNGTYHYLATASVNAQQDTYDGVDYGMDVEMLVHLGGLQGFARVWRIVALGEFRSAHTLRWRVGTYKENSYFDDEPWDSDDDPDGYVAGDELEVDFGPSEQQHKALRIRLTSSPTSPGEQLRLSALSLELGLKPGLYPRLSPAQRL